MDKKGLAAVCAAAFFWGTLGIASKKAFISGMDPLSIVFFRLLLAALLLGVFLLLADRQKLVLAKRDIPAFLFYALFSGTLYNLFYFKAIQWTTVTTATVLLYTCPAFVIVIAYFLLGEKINRVKVISLFLTLSGIYLVVKGYDLGSLKVNVPGILFGIGAGFSFAVLSIMGRILTRRYHPLTLIFYSCVIGLLFLLMIKPGLLTAPMIFSPGQWLYLAYVAIFPTLLSNFLFYWGLKRVESGYAALAATSEPVVAVVLSWLILGEKLALLQVIGALAVLGAVIFTGWSRPKHALAREAGQIKLSSGEGC